MSKKKSKRKYAQNHLSGINAADIQRQKDLSEKQPEFIRDKRKLRFHNSSGTPRSFTIWQNQEE